ncbi:MAG: hypothetical protein PHO66_00200 [Eubacteriales bacterium]|nr:hypothetical protein [Eubacteriales bacterium]
MRTKDDRVRLRRWARLQLALSQLRRGAMSRQEFYQCADLCAGQKENHA